MKKTLFILFVFLFVFGVSTVTFAQQGQFSYSHIGDNYTAEDGKKQLNFSLFLYGYDESVSDPLSEEECAYLLSMVLSHSSDSDREAFVAKAVRNKAMFKFQVTYPTHIVHLWIYYNNARSPMIKGMFESLPRR
jgi:hypothetical protein